MPPHHGNPGNEAHATPDGEDRALSAESLRAYFDIQEALAADTLEGVAERAAKIGDEWEFEAASKLAEAEDLDTARVAFRGLSQHFIEQLKAHGMPEGHARLAHCPMAFDNEGADWLQKGETLANPYYGASMLRCGSTKEVFGEEDNESPGAHAH